MIINIKVLLQDEGKYKKLQRVFEPEHLFHCCLEVRGHSLEGQAQEKANHRYEQQGWRRRGGGVRYCLIR